MNNNMEMEPTPNYRWVKVLIVVLLLCILVSLSVIVYVDLNGKDNKSDNFSKQKEETKEGLTPIEDDNGKNNLGVGNGTLSEDKTTYAKSGYTFMLPNELSYANKSDMLYADGKLFGFSMTVDNYSYEVVKNASESIAEELRKTGFDVTSYGLIKDTSGSIEFFAFVLVDSEGNQGYYYFIQLDKAHCSEGTILSDASQGVDQAFSYVNQIVSSATKPVTFAEAEAEAMPSEYSGISGIITSFK